MTEVPKNEAKTDTSDGKDSNPFNYEENPAANTLYQHIEWARTCLARSLGMADYAGIVLRNTALDHLNRAMLAAEQYRIESSDREEEK